MVVKNINDKDANTSFIKNEKVVAVDKQKRVNNV